MLVRPSYRPTMTVSSKNEIGASRPSCANCGHSSGLTPSGLRNCGGIYCVVSRKRGRNVAGSRARWILNSAGPPAC